ncbi:MAG: extracellular solute-binding protein, partial [Oscillospiraceae bacterium]|nr:extracellular solute-binding protein [Oscillospiraceae bacterium]
TEFSIWRQLVNNDFTEKTGIKINFKNVSTSFQSAFLAGMLPDVYVGMDVQSLMEFAFRDVIITDLTSVAPQEELTDALKNYNKWLYYPVKYEGKLFGFPMTTSVPATFYRTDIFEEMGLEIPEVLTWDDVIYFSTMLQKKNLEVGLTPGIGTWKNLIYQKGGYTVDEDRKEVYLMNDLAIETFTTYTSFFTEYSSPVSFSAFDRFRTGEMPMVFSDASFINQLEVLAPEITGKWDFTTYPATLDENGNPDYTIGGGSTSYMVITNRRPEMAEKAWEFIKWRGSTETLVSVNRRLEMSIGRSVRTISPNGEAQDQIPWSTKVQQLYDFYHSYEYNDGEGWRFSEPEVPGDYFV